MLSPSHSMTTTALLESLFSEEDPAAWQAFDSRLRPILLGVAARMGLSEADAQDAVQECLAQVIAGARDGGYDRSKGRLRTWVIAVLKNRVRDVHRRRQRAPAMASESAIARLPADDELERVWEEESRRRLIADALETLRRSGEVLENNLRAFELYALEEKPAADVARELGMTRWAVYKATKRCKSLFQKLVVELTASYELLEPAP